MKRSDVLKELDILIHCGPRYPTEEQILSKLEELGMKPPTHPTKGYEVTEITPSGTLNYYRQTINEWEDE